MLSWPKSVTCLRDYSRSTFLHDLVAGITVGLVAVPLAMAFAISSGLTPQAGLYTAVITGFLISALGGSRVQIGGPTGAFVVVIAGIVAKHGIDGLFMCTMMAGVLLVILGLTGMGTAVKFIPRPIVIGFTNGIALLIASTQVKDFFGLTLEKVPGEFLPRVQALAANFRSLSLASAALGAGTVLTIVLFMRYARRVPGTIIALFAGTAISLIFNLPVETIATRFGGIPSGLPHLAFPQFRPELFHGLLQPALTVAMLGAIESLMSATVADRMIGDRHDPNLELFAQGVANIFSPIFGGLPATGAIARTATNIRSGGRTPVAGIVHAATIAMVLLAGAPLVQYIPLSVLAGILMMVAYNMGEWAEIPLLLRLTKGDITVWAVTFLLTVFADLTVAVEVGMILAALLFIQKVTTTTTVSRVTQDYLKSGRAHILHDQRLPEYAAIFRIHGPFLFGATDKISEIIDRLVDLPPVVILRLRNMTAIDATGIATLENIADQLHVSGRTLILCGAREQPARVMARADFESHLGRENICPNVAAALARAEVVHRDTVNAQEAGVT